MSPFTTPDRVFISRRPQDMRAGIQRLASIVATDFGEGPQDGPLCCFASRDCGKMELLRFGVNGRRLRCCGLADGIFHWRHRPDLKDPKLIFGRRRLMRLLDGVDLERVDAPNPVAANRIL